MSLLNSKKTFQRSKPGAGSAGQAALEFALVLPMFLIVFIGIFEIGRFIYIHQLLDQIAREASRSGAVTIRETSVTNAIASANSLLLQYNLSAQSTVAAQIISVNGSDAVSVTVTYHYAPVLHIDQLDLPPAMDIASTVRMRLEG